MEFPPLHALTISAKRDLEEVQLTTFEELLSYDYEHVLAADEEGIKMLKAGSLAPKLLRLTQGKEMLCGSSNCALPGVRYAPEIPVFRDVAALNPEFKESTVLLRIPGWALRALVAKGQRFVPLKDVAVEEEAALREAMYGLRLASVGVAPRVLAAYPIPVQLDVERQTRIYRLFLYVMPDGFKTLDEADDTPTGVVELFTRAAAAGVILADCKPDNVVRRGDEASMIDFDTLFTLVDTEIDPVALEAATITLFLNCAASYGWDKSHPLITAALCKRLKALLDGLPAYGKNELGNVFFDSGYPTTIAGLDKLYKDMPLVSLHSLPREGIQKHLARLHVRMLYRYAKEGKGLLETYLKSGRNVFHGAAVSLCGN